MSKKKKDEIIPSPAILPATDSNLANSLADTVSNSEADYTMAYKDIDGVGRLTAESKNMPAGTKEIKLTAVPKTSKKKYLKEDVKAMKKNGEKMENIAKKTDMSTSYAYKLNRED